MGILACIKLKYTATANVLDSFVSAKSQQVDITKQECFAHTLIV
jgi:hypothetical protein